MIGFLLKVNKYQQVLKNNKIKVDQNIVECWNQVNRTIMRVAFEGESFV